eukprot:RCo048669
MHSARTEALARRVIAVYSPVVSEAELRAAFQWVPGFVGMQALTRPDGWPKGVATADFQTPEAAQAAVAVMNNLEIRPGVVVRVSCMGPKPTGPGSLVEPVMAALVRNALSSVLSSAGTAVATAPPTVPAAAHPR